MKREIISNNIKIFGGFLFIIISVLELINLSFILFTPFEINGSSTAFAFLILQLDYGFLFSFILWFTLFMIIFFFLINGFYFLKISKNELESFEYSKHLFLMGLILLILTFFKMCIIYFIEIGEIMIGGEMIQLESALQDFNYMPIYSFYMWRLLTVSDCYRLIFGLVMGGFGLYWHLIEEKRNNLNAA
ncbi:MAG: hypothetical protein EU518_02000 [Promethearchaeota archaeon]|nr:MAG: hypothetical protein EU518_02000 [Candidatus Lokiarchaeota archaeon]